MTQEHQRGASLLGGGNGLETGFLGSSLVGGLRGIQFGNLGFNHAVLDLGKEQYGFSELVSHRQQVRLSQIVPAEHRVI